MLSDEQQALQLAFMSLESKCRRLKEDNNDLVSRWMQLKSQDADRMNLENEAVVRAKQKVVQQQLEDAAAEHREISAGSR